MGLARQGVQRIVNDLQGLEMVVSKANLDHKRASLISITTQGDQAMAKIGKAQVAWVNQLSEGLGERQIKQSFETLRRIRERSEKS